MSLSWLVRFCCCLYGHHPLFCVGSHRRQKLYIVSVLRLSTQNDLLYVSTLEMHIVREVVRRTIVRRTIVRCIVTRRNDAAGRCRDSLSLQTAVQSIPLQFTHAEQIYKQPTFSFWLVAPLVSYTHQHDVSAYLLIYEQSFVMFRIIAEVAFVKSSTVCTRHSRQLAREVCTTQVASDSHITCSNSKCKSCSSRHSRFTSQRARYIHNDRTCQICQNMCLEKFEYLNTKLAITRPV